MFANSEGRKSWAFTQFVLVSVLCLYKVMVSGETFFDHVFAEFSASDAALYLGASGAVYGHGKHVQSKDNIQQKS